MSDEKVIDRWNKAAQYYDESYSKNAFYPIMIERIIQLANPNADDVVLDIGTGTGALAIKIAPKVRKVIAIDTSEEMLKLAKEKAKQADMENIEFKIGSFTEPNVDEQLDIIISNLVFEWVPDRDKRTAINAMSSLLKGSGRAILGERMLFFDVVKEPERAEEVLNNFMTRLTGKSMSEFHEEFEKVKDKIDYDSLRDKFQQDHNEIKCSAENLTKLFEENGFKVEKVEEIMPILGIISARKA